MGYWSDMTESDDRQAKNGQQVMLYEDFPKREFVKSTR